jgi:dihydropyrimidinase
MAEDVDVLIRGGTVVTADGRSATDVGIRDGRVVQIGGEMTAANEIDASGKLLLPGGVDMHVHLSPVELAGETIDWADDFNSGSRAAAAGGVTTVGNITFTREGDGLGATIERVAADAERDSIVDFVLHPVLIDPTPEAIAEIPQLAKQGHTSIKIFMSIGEFDSRAGGFLEAMSVAGQNGVLTLIHCEDACVISLLTRRLVAEGRGDLSNYGVSRPLYSETVAVARAIAFAEAAEAPIYIVHLGSADALAEAHRAHARGLPVFIETRPIYLHFTSEKFAGPDAPLYVGNPPLREQRDQDALWGGLACADVHTCCTDHAAWTLEQKLDPTLTIETARPGMSDLETLMPLLWSRGVEPGRISVERFVEVTSTNAAKLFGLYPRKGTIAVGSDADIVVWDPELSRVVSGAEGMSRSGYTLYEGWEVSGWPAYTISRGEVIYADGQVTAAAGRGRLVHRERTRPL